MSNADWADYYKKNIAMIMVIAIIIISAIISLLLYIFS